MTMPQRSPGRTLAERHAPLSYALAQAAWGHSRRMRHLLGEIGLFQGQELLVVELACTPGATQSDLTTRLNVEQPTVAKMVARLERAGVVRRQGDPHDARVVRLFLAGDGDALAAAVIRRWEALDQQMAAGLSHAETTQLRALLDRVRKNFGDTPR